MIVERGERERELLFPLFRGEERKNEIGENTYGAGNKLNVRKIDRIRETLFSTRVYTGLLLFIKYSIISNK